MRPTTSLVLAALALLLTALVFAPAGAYLPNPTEVSVSLGEVLRAAWPWALGLTLLTVALSRLGATVARGASVVYLLLAVGIFVQGTFFVWDYGPFDGSEVPWNRFRWHGALEIGVLLALTVLFLVQRRRVADRSGVLAVALIVLQTVTLSVQLAQGASLRAQTATDPSEGIFDFSPERNVLVIVLDAFQRAAFEAVLQRRPELAADLDGFTLYRDALGLYPTTLMSIPAMLSGLTYDNTETIPGFLGRSLSRSLPRVLLDSGYRVHTVTQPSYCPYLDDVHCAGQRDFLSDPEVERRRDVLQIWDLALFRSSPHMLRRLIYRDHQWLLQRTLLDRPEEEGEDAERMELIPSQRASWKLWNSLVTEATTASDRPTFKFIHLFTTHSPFVLDVQCRPLSKRAFKLLTEEEKCVAQAECSVNQIVTTLQRLAALGVYDQTLVVFTADHGSKTQIVPRSKEWDRLPNVNRVFPLLLVKPPGARGPLKRSDAAVSLSDLPRTVADAMGVESDFPGVSVLADVLPQRSRLYYDYTWKSRFWDAEYLPLVTEFQITGLARAAESWSRTRIIRDPALEGQSTMRRH